MPDYKGLITDIYAKKGLDASKINDETINTISERYKDDVGGFLNDLYDKKQFDKSKLTDETIGTIKERYGFTQEAQAKKPKESKPKGVDGAIQVAREETGQRLNDRQAYQYFDEKAKGISPQQLSVSQKRPWLNKDATEQTLSNREKRREKNQALTHKGELENFFRERDGFATPEEGYAQHQLEQSKQAIDEAEKTLSEIVERGGKTVHSYGGNTVISTSEEYDNVKRKLADVRHIKQLHKKALKVLEAPEGRDFEAQMKGFAEGLFKSPLAADYFTFGVNEIARNNNIVAAFEKPEEERTPEERALLQAYYDLQEFAAGRMPNRGGRIGEGVAEMLPYIVQFAVTNGVGTAARESVEAGFANMAKRYLTNAAKKGLTSEAKQQAVSKAITGTGKAIGYATGAGAQTLANPQMIAREATTRMLPQLEYDEAGQPHIVAGEKPGEAIAKAFGITYAEFFGENFGGVFGSMGNALKKNPKGIMRAVAGVSDGWNKLLGDKLEKVGWHGLFEEYLEEQVTGLIQSPINQDWSFFTDLNNQLDLLGTLAVTQGAFGMNNNVSRMRIKRGWKEAQEITQNVDDPEYMAMIQEVEELYANDAKGRDERFQTVNQAYQPSEKDVKIAKNYIIRKAAYDALETVKQDQYKDAVTEMSHEDGNAYFITLDNGSQVYLKSGNPEADGEMLVGMDGEGKSHSFSKKNISKIRPATPEEMTQKLQSQDNMEEEVAAKEERNIAEGYQVGNLVYQPDPAGGKTVGEIVDFENSDVAHVLFKGEEVPRPIPISQLVTQKQVDAEEAAAQQAEEEQAALEAQEKQNETKSQGNGSDERQNDTTAPDGDSNVSQESAETAIEYPTKKDGSIDYDAVEPNQLQGALQKDGFSEEEIGELIQEERNNVAEELDKAEKKLISAKKLADKVQLKKNIKALQGKLAQFDGMIPAAVEDAEGVGQTDQVSDQATAPPPATEQAESSPEVTTSGEDVSQKDVINATEAKAQDLQQAESEAATSKEKKQSQKKGIMQTASELEVFDVPSIIMQHFISGGKINTNAIQEIFGGGTNEKEAVKAERNKRISYIKKDAPTIDGLAHDLWQQNEAVAPNATDVDYRDEIINIISSYNHPASMAKDLISLQSQEQSQEISPEEQAYNAEILEQQLIEEVILSEYTALEADGLLPTADFYVNLQLEPQENEQQNDPGAIQGDNQTESPGISEEGGDKPTGSNDKGNIQSEGGDGSQSESEELKKLRSELKRKQSERKKHDKEFNDRNGLFGDQKAESEKDKAVAAGEQALFDVPTDISQDNYNRVVGTLDKEIADLKTAIAKLEASEQTGAKENSGQKKLNGESNGQGEQAELKEDNSEESSTFENQSKENANRPKTETGRESTQDAVYRTAEAGNRAGDVSPDGTAEDIEELESRGINPYWDSSLFHNNLKNLAEKNGVLLPPSYLEGKTKVHDKNTANTSENDIYSSGDGKTIIKVNDLKYVVSGNHNENLSALLDRIEAHNQLFPELSYSIKGYIVNERGKTSLVMEQPYIQSERNASKEEIEEWLKNHNFKLDGVRDWSNNHEVWSDGKYELFDARPANVLFGKDGELYFIDTFPHTKSYLDSGIKTESNNNQITEPAPQAESKESAPEKQGGESKESQEKKNQNKVFTEDAKNAALERIRQRRGNLNSGLNPEDMNDIFIVGGYYVESGIRKFSDFAKQMVNELGAWVKPYLKGAYVNMSLYAGFEGGISEEMDDIRTVKAFDLNTIQENNVTLQDDAEHRSDNIEQTSPDSSDEVRADEADVSSSTNASAGRGRESNVETGTDSEQEQPEPAKLENSLNDLGSIAPVVGESSDKRVRDEGESAGTKKRTSRNTNPRGSNNSAEQGATLFDQIPIEENTRDNNGHSEPTSGVELGNIENIRETLPGLYPEQQDDVLKAERRFFTGEKTGKGILFTNGTGTGKTYTGLGIAKRFDMNGKKDILFVVPTDAKAKDWIEDGQNVELSITQLKDTKQAGEGAVVTTYANFYQNEAIQGREFDLVIYDESHYLNQNEGGGRTVYYDAHQKVANLPSTAKSKAALVAGEKPTNPSAPQYPGSYATEEELEQYRKESEQHDKDYAAYKSNKKAWDERYKKALDEIYNKTKVVFLSASPFAYHKTLQYGDGTLLDIYETLEEKEYNGGYNVASGMEAVLTENFGYRMRYNKANRPESGVDQSLLEREFYERMVKEGIFSGRQLQVDKDYSRDFVLIDSELGQKINEGFKLFHSFDNGDFREKYPNLSQRAYKKWNFLYMNQLIESIKASKVGERVQEHLNLGRKVVLFHGYNNALPAHPFKFEPSELYSKSEFNDSRFSSSINDVRAEIENFEAEYPELVNLDLSGLENPRIAIAAQFGEQSREFNGTVSRSKRFNYIKEFNDPDSGVDILLVQRKAGKEGISLHDIQGNKQRVLIDLGLPTAPTDAIQTEGRIYRLGVQSDAIFEYPVLHTDFEKYAFAMKVATRAKTAENLAMGNMARDLETAFKEGYQNAIEDAPSREQGKGGKEMDSQTLSTSEFDQAKTYYFARGKRTSRNKSQEGVDYFATPEPIGYKMAEWLDLRPNEHALEPSAGHGAIARFFPGDTNNTFVEPSYSLSSQLSINVHGNVKQQTFEDLHIINKYDAIAMNPPFGKGGKTAMEHVEKAFDHLHTNGRIVAIVPNGPSMQKRLDNFLYGENEKGKPNNPDAVLVAEINLPSVTFERAGTSVNTKIIVIDKISDENYTGHTQNLDLSRYDKIGDLFDAIEDMNIPNRNVSSIPVIEEAPVLTNDDLVDSEVFGKPEEFTHTKTGDTLYNVPLNDRIENFKQIADLAKKHNPYNSRRTYDGKFAKGFLFKTMEDAQNFYNDATTNKDVSFRKTPEQIFAENPDMAFLKNAYDKNEEIRTELDRLSEKYGVPVEYVVSYEQLPGYIADELKRQAGDVITGVFDKKTGKVYAIIPAISDVQDAQKLFLHEVVGHYGIDKILGREDVFLDTMYNIYDGMNLEQIQYYENLYGTKDPVIIASEYLAEVAEDNPTLTWVGKAISAIRKAIRAIFPDMKMNKIEVVGLIAKSRSALKKEAKNTAQQRVSAIARDIDNYVSNPDKWDKEFFERRKISNLVQYETESVQNTANESYDPQGRFADDLFSRHNYDSGKQLTAKELRQEVDSQLQTWIDNHGLKVYDKDVVDYWFNKLPGITGQVNKEGYQGNDVFSLSHEIYKHLPENSKPPKKSWVDLSSPDLQYRKKLSNPAPTEAEATEKLNDKLYRRFVDRMQPYINFQSKGVGMGAKLDKTSNFELAENRQSSIAKAKFDKYHDGERQELIDAAMPLYQKKGYDALSEYMMAKHAGERNLELLTREAEQKGYDKEKVDEYIKTLDNDNRSGYTTEEADKIIKAFEKDFDAKSLDKFWTAVKKNSDYVLDRYYEAGFIDKKTKEHYQSMYKNYVPLRGWDEAEAENTEYFRDTFTGKVNMNKKAEGRSSIAADPLATMVNMAYSAIASGEKNIAKQKAFYFVLGNQEVLKPMAELKEYWQVPVGKDVYEYYTQEEFMQLDESRREGAKKVNAKEKQAKMSKAQAAEKEVHVWVNGRMYTMVFDDLKVAHALNKESSPMVTQLGEFLQNSVGRVTRRLSGLLTSDNPAFIIPNLIKDTLFAVEGTFIEDGGKAAAKLTKNIFKVQRALVKFQQGKEDNTKLGGMMKDFVELGGQTGYSHLESVDQIKKTLAKELRNASIMSESKLAKYAVEGIKKPFELIEHLASWSENVSRFATYVTAIEMGKSKEEAIAASKNVTVNFNRKGELSGILGSLYMFFNARMQGIARVFKLAKTNPGRFAAVAAGHMAIGYASMLLFDMLTGGDDDKDQNISDYMKFKYLVIPGGENGYVSIPLPHGTGFFHGLGVLTYEMLSGKKEPMEATGIAVSNALSEFAPMDIASISADNDLAENASVFVPSALKPIYDVAVTNKDYLGRDIARTPFTKGDEEVKAESQMYYKNVNPVAKYMTDLLYEIGGGDPNSSLRFKKGTTEPVNKLLDQSPEHLEYLVESYTGGTGKFFNDIYKSIVRPTVNAVSEEGSFKDNYVNYVTENVSKKDIPVFNRFIRSYYGDPIISNYYDQKHKLEVLGKWEAEFKKAKDRESRIELRSQPEYKQYRKMKIYDRRIKSYNDRIRNHPESPEVDNWKAKRKDLMEEFLKYIEEDGNSN